MTDIDAIVAGLSEAQREALSLEAVRDGDETKVRCDLFITPACRCALQRKKLFVDRMYSTTFTDLGLAVRAVILRGQ